MAQADFSSFPYPHAVTQNDKEADRLAELHRYDILDTAPEEQFDRIANLARVLFDTPMASVTLVDRDRQWFKAKIGIDDDETSRDLSFCSRAMENEGVFVVQNAKEDPRFADNALVTGGPQIRFYAGAPLRSSNGQNLGAVCVISPTPRDDFSAADQDKLKVLARIVEAEMELRLRARQAHKAMFDKDMALRDAHYRVRNSLDYANLLADVQSEEMTTEKLSVLAMAAWKQYSEAGAVLNGSIKALRSRMQAAEYRALLDNMPGFAF
jgi:hypothetical protein